jgi:MFS family permease
MKKKYANFLLILGIVFVALNLRTALTSVGPLISSIREDLLLSSGMAGLLTTIPLLAFAVISPLAPKIGNRWGYEGTILIGLLVLSAGIAVRSMTFTVALITGTMLIGIGIAVCNVILPAIVKRNDRPHDGAVFNNNGGIWLDRCWYKCSSFTKSWTWMAALSFVLGDFIYCGCCRVASSSSLGKKCCRESGS